MAPVSGILFTMSRVDTTLLPLRAGPMMQRLASIGGILSRPANAAAADKPKRVRSDSDPCVTYVASGSASDLVRCRHSVSDLSSVARLQPSSVKTVG
ncbi:hypothetical protein Caci_5102 [Catenulispora acidiphila DSM 44928]|uniref:Uncharacterized protein n=1 Tax=Catenulispora acidiphila (strain DSM 44928 / JCM 14897 / NBRC 102108 / NRRL B-24433 / ID139908) TaxID=479433 RepID=C7Q514_CATAD|nr:hypothetical protein Caci_5102 [Catenulispora acidiphila DSM 44928]